MKQIKQELRRRDIVFDESDKAPELKAKLMKSLKGKNIKIQITFCNEPDSIIRSMFTKINILCSIGIKRPAALLCSGRDQAAIADYEIGLVEPLHDIKNIINRIFEDLPHAVSEPELKQTIKTSLELLRRK